MWNNFRNLYFILWDHERYERVAGADQVAFASPFKSHFLHSLFGAALAIAIAIIAGFLGDRMALGYAPAWGKVAAVGGAFLAAWGTWFGIQDRQSSYKGSRIDEKLRDFVFELTFFPGVILAVFGTLW